MNKILTFYSDSHKELFNNFFLYSFNKYLNKNYKLISKNIPQVCPSGEFASLGFDDAMLEKVKFIIDNININDENYLIFSDCDVQFFSEPNEDLNSYDILFQQDYPNYFCAGFFICKQNQKILNFFNRVKNKFEESKNGKIDDQWVINEILTKEKLDISYSFLPKNRYWSVGNSTLGKVWGGQDITVPNDLIMHHANFTIGIKNKINILNLVKKINEK